MPRCEFCKPKRHRIDYPGGFIWRHSPSCKYASQVLGRERDPEQEARRLHPAGSNLVGSFSKGFHGWDAQPQIGPMTEPVAYIDAWVDRDDDEEAEA